tara:strand:+ start:4995 stop:6056 length:1062 start_codon:yes stop_codon:yes gene_type:complete
MKSHTKRHKKGGNPKYRLKPDEADILYQYRRARDECEKEDIDPKTLHSGWIKSENASLYFQQPKAQEEDFKKMSEELIKEVSQHSPQYKKIPRDQKLDGHLFFCCPSDLHIGKLCKSFVSGEEYDSQMAVLRALSGVNGCIDKAKGFPIDKVVFLLSGDLLHVDNLSNTTTKGTPQDTDGLFSDNFLIAKRLMVDIIETLVQLADVHIMFTPGNHDHVSGWLMAQVLQAHFRKNKNISWDISMQMRKYYKYHNNLISSTHGDAVKWALLPMLMADESKDWSDTKYRYMFTQHIHHKVTAKNDFVGVTMESLRSPSEADAWHHKSGYSSSNNKAIESFLFSKENGQVARITHLF